MKEKNKIKSSVARKKLENARRLLEIHGKSGNWDYDNYMHGMYNGMELVLSIWEGREVAYRDAPEKFSRSKDDYDLKEQTERTIQKSSSFYGTRWIYKDPGVRE